MAFTGNEDHHISLEEAAKLTKRYRDSVASGTVLGSFFGKAALESILNQDGCVGIRIYYAKAENGAPKFVLVGADSNEDDLYGGDLAEFSFDCPPNCSKANPLNS